MINSADLHGVECSLPAELTVTKAFTVETCPLKLYQAYNAERYASWNINIRSSSSEVIFTTFHRGLDPIKLPQSRT